jgi:hypothetical protein
MKIQRNTIGVAIKLQGQLLEKAATINNKHGHQPKSTANSSSSSQAATPQAKLCSTANTTETSTHTNLQNSSSSQAVTPQANDVQPQPQQKHQSTHTFKAAADAGKETKKVGAIAHLSLIGFPSGLCGLLLNTSRVHTD